MRVIDKSEHRMIDIVGLLSTILLVVLIGYLFGGSSLQAVRELNDEQRKLAVRLEHLTELNNVIGQGKATLDDLKLGMAEISERLPLTMGFDQFYSSLTDFANKNKILISEMRPGEITKEDDYIELPISMNATAKFEDFHKFLFALNNMKRITKLDSLAIQVASKPEFCDVQMTIKIYAAIQSLNEESNE